VIDRVGRVAAIGLTAAGLAVAAACEPSSTPGAPEPPSAGAIFGLVTRHGATGPVAGAVVTFGSRSAVTGPDGAFRLDEVGVRGSVYLRAMAPGYLERWTLVDVPPAGGPVEVDMIEDAAPFSLDFYRQLARNSRESQNGLTPLLTWILPPSFYVKTTTEDTGEDVPEDVVDEVIRVIVSSVPELSGGRLQAAAVETGREARPLVHGWVNVLFFRDVEGGLGRATYGGPAGFIHLTHDPDRTDSGACASLAANLAEHEVVHTMGFFHTDRVGLDFYTPDCSGTGRPERVQHHAAVAYARPCLNRDEDIDPVGATPRCDSTASSSLAALCAFDESRGHIDPRRRR
jgi:hypothetical protein